MHLFSDSFDGYAALADLTTRWSSKGASGIAYNASGGRFGGGCVEFTSANAVLASRTFRTSYDAATTARISLAFSVKISAAPSSNATFLRLRNYLNSVTTSDVGAVWLNTTGCLSLGEWSTGSLPSPVGGINVCDNQWHWIELDLYYADSGGFLILRVDGTTDVNKTGDTRSGASDPNLLDRLQFPGISSITISLDDLVVYDNIAGTTAGDLRSSVNFPLGDQRMSLIKPDGAGSSADASPSAGANWQCVDETVLNSDTDYVQSATVGHDDLYTFGAMPVSPTTVLGVAVSNFAKYTNTGGPDVKGKAKSSASTATGAAKVLTSAYVQSQEFFAQDPNTAAAWSEAGVNAAEFGFELA